MLTIFTLVLFGTSVPFDPLKMLSVMLGSLNMNPVSRLAKLTLYYLIPFCSSKITGWARMEVRMVVSHFERLFLAAKLKDFSSLKHA